MRVSGRILAIPEYFLPQGRKGARPLKISISRLNDVFGGIAGGGRRRGSPGHPGRGLAVARGRVETLVIVVGEMGEAKGRVATSCPSVLS